MVEGKKFKIMVEGKKVQNHGGGQRRNKDAVLPGAPYPARYRSFFTIKLRNSAITSKFQVHKSLTWPKGGMNSVSDKAFSEIHLGLITDIVQNFSTESLLSNSCIF